MSSTSLLLDDLMLHFILILAASPLALRSFVPRGDQKKMLAKFVKDQGNLQQKKWGDFFCFMWGWDQDQ